MTWIKDLLYDLWYGIKNLVIYFRVIWRDRNWDFYYIYALMEKKISLQRKCVEKFSLHEDKEKTIKQMKFAENTLRRLMEDDYYFQAFEKFNKKWGELEWVKNEFGDALVRRGAKGNEEECHKELVEHFEIENMLRSRDRRNLFRLLDKHINTWWN